MNYKNTISAKDCSHADRYHSVQGLFGRRDVLFGPIGACVDELGSMGLRLRRLSERLARAFARCGCVESALGGFTVIILSARLLDLWRSYQIFYFRPEHPRRILSLSPRDPPSDPWSPFMSLSLMNSCTQSPPPSGSSKSPCLFRPETPLGSSKSLSPRSLRRILEVPCVRFA